MRPSAQSTPTAIEPASIDWWIFVIWGATSVVVGALLLFQPIASALVLVSIFAVLWLIGGIVDIVGALGHRVGHWGWRIASGALGVLVALFVLGDPLVGTIAAVSVLYLLVALTALVSGITGVFSGERSLSRIVLSVFQAVLAVLMLIGFLDIVSLRILVQALGLLGIGGGIVAALSAFHFRHPETAGV